MSPVQQAERLEAMLCHTQRLLPPEQWSNFRQAILRPAPLCVRLNRLLPRHAQAVLPALRARGQVVSWCEDAFILHDHDDDAPVGNTLEWSLGALYVQAKATTLAAQVLAPQPGDRVLDLAAAPGGKATQIANLMNNQGLLVANELRHRRMAALVGNLERCGIHNTVLTSVGGAMLARWFHNVFDRVLLDAPCSGDGIIAKSRGQLAYWSPEDATRKSVQQIGLLRAAFHMLRPGGVLVYSTCSLSTEENEDVLLGLLRRYGDAVDIESARNPGGLEVASTPLVAAVAATYPESFRRCIRIWPHEHQTEGGFVARVRKARPTTWNRVEGDLTLDLSDFDRDAENMSDLLQQRWGFAPDIPPGQQLARRGRYVNLGPAVGAPWARELPSFLRAGMRVGSMHKQHLFLSQQAVGLWGDRPANRRLQLTWPQVQTLFADNKLRLTSPAPKRGEVIGAFGPWAVCRGVVAADGLGLAGFVPRGLRHANLGRLLP